MKSALMRFPRLCGVLAAVLVLVGLTPGAAAQFMGGPDPTSFVTPISRRSLDDYAQILSLTPEQKESVKALHEGYTAAHAEARKEMSKAYAAAMEKVQETQDWQVLQKELPRQMRAIGETIEKLEKGFLDDVRALLDARQDEKWVRVERHRRRENGTRMAMVSGQGVDLVRVLNTLKIDPAAAPELQDSVERYEADMDRAIAAMQGFQKEQEAKYADFEIDMSKMQELMKEGERMLREMVERARALRDVNRQYARLIESALAEEQRPAFRAEVNRRTYPLVYRESWESKAISAALGFNDLAADQRSALTALTADYRSEAEGLNREWASAVQAQENKTGGQALEWTAMMGGQDEETRRVKAETNRARAARKDLDKRIRTKLMAILTEGQQDRLPEERKAPAGLPMGGGDFFGVPEDDEGK